MRGQVLGVDRISGQGQIAGEDGQRYTFAREDWSDANAPANGVTVDFATEGTRALRVFHAPGRAEPTMRALGVDRGGAPVMPKSKIAAALLAFFLGLFGVHKFYLGKTTAGIIMLLCGTLGWILLAIPPMIIGVIAFIEFIIYLVKSDEDFQRDYVLGDRAWF